jgi:hypothetical protein
MVEILERFMSMVRDSLNNNGIYSINNGGCGFFASELSKIMMEFFGIPEDDIEVLVYDYKTVHISNIDDISTIEEHMLEHGDDISSIYSWNDNGVDFAHIMLGYKEYYLDCTGIAEKEDNWCFYPLVNGSMSLYALGLLGNSAEGWNIMFDRSQIPTIKKILQDCANEVLTT